MGGDGGQVIDRATMVKTRGYGLTKESGGRYNNSLGEMNSYLQLVPEDRGIGPLERHRIRMTQCWLSQQKLREPVVACRLGNLYSKEALIGALLNKSLPERLGHIRALKDVKLCLLTWAEGAEAVLSQMTTEAERQRMVCPVSREDLDTGGARAVIIWTSGAVVSAKSLKELKMKECPLTGKPFDPEKDVVPLAPDEDELARLRERLPERKKRKAESQATRTDDAKRGGPGSDDKGKAPARDESQADDRKSGVYGSIFQGGRGADDGKLDKDAFGTPLYNRGALIQ